MTLKATFVKALQPAHGIGKTGKEWLKQDGIFTFGDKYPKEVCVTFWGEGVKDLEAMAAGEVHEMEVEASSREYNGRWYTEVRCLKVDTVFQHRPVVTAKSAVKQGKLEPVMDEDLPF